MKRRRRDFTLIEMVVAAALLALTGMIAAVVVQTFARSYAKAQKAGGLLERNQALDRIAEDCLRSAVPFTWPDDDSGSDELVFDGGENELHLTALNRSHGGRGALRFVRIYQEDDRLLCDYSFTPFVPWKELDDQDYETELICGDVLQVTFSYAAYDDDDELKWYESWDPDEHDGLPTAIQMTVEWRDGTKERWLRRTAGASFNTEYLSGAPSQGGGEGREAGQ